MPTCEKCQYTAPEQDDLFTESQFDFRKDFITFYSRGERKHHTFCSKCFYGGRNPYEMTRQQLQQQHTGHVLLTVERPRFRDPRDDMQTAHNMGGGNEPVEM